MPPPVQAKLSLTADISQEAHRRYLLHRLVPAMAACYGSAAFDAARTLSGNWPSTPHHMKRHLDACPTRLLEARLEELYFCMLMVRIAVFSNTSIWVHERWDACNTGWCNGCFTGHVPALCGGARALCVCNISCACNASVWTSCVSA